MFSGIIEDMATVKAIEKVEKISISLSVAPLPQSLK